MGRLIVHVGDATWVEHLHPRAGTGQFTIKGGVGASGKLPSKHHIEPQAGAQPRELPPELNGPPEPGKPFLMFRLGAEGEGHITERNTGNSYGVAEHLTHVDDPESAQGIGGSGDHINVFTAYVKQPAGRYQPMIAGRGGGFLPGVGYRSRGPGKPCAISLSFGKGGYHADLLASIPLKEVREALKARGYADFDDAGWRIGGEIIRDVALKHLMPETHDQKTVHVHWHDDSAVWIESKHPRGQPENAGEFASKGGGGAGGGAVPQREPLTHIHVHQGEPQRKAAPPQQKPARAQQKPALTGSKGHAATISSRFPTAIRGTEKPDEDYLQTGLPAMKANPDKFRDAMHLFRHANMYPYFRPEELHGSPDQIAETVIGRMVSNLKYFAEHAPPLTKKFGGAWYGEENRKAQAMAGKYRKPLQSVAGTYAALSPQKDWNMNVYLGDRVMEAMELKPGAATAWSPEMDRIASVIVARKTATDQMKHLVALARGKSLEDLDTPLLKGVWVRMWDEAKPKQEQLVRLFRPDGEPGDYMRTDKGKPQKAQWGGFNTIANAIQAYTSGGDRSIISDAMGAQNKVRSFYNNILDPTSDNGDLTVDTHAIGAALMDALGGSTAPVSHGLGTGLQKKHQPAGYRTAPSPATTGVAGLYGLYAEAYRRAAKDLGMRPLELQSLTWEAKRALFEHMPAGGRGAVHKAWDDFHAGKGTFEEAREAAVKAAGGFKEPDWTRAAQDLTPAELGALEVAE